MSIESINVRSIFDHALELASESDRKAYLDEACAASPEIRQRVEVLLNAHANAGSFLQEPAVGPAANRRRLTNEDLEAIGRNRDKLIKFVHARYEITPEEAADAICEFEKEVRRPGATK